MELRWWRRHVVALLRRPGWLCVLVAVFLLGLPDSVTWLAAGLGFVVSARVWAHVAPSSYAAVAGPLDGWLVRRRIRRAWRSICVRCGLSDVVEPRAMGLVVAEPKTVWPPLSRGRVSWPHLEFVARPLVGQRLSDFEAAAEAIRTATGATRLRVDPHGPSGVRLTFTIGDRLHAPFSAAVGPSEAEISSVVLGVREEGKVWRLPVGPHTLVAGCSGSGKGSVFWSFAFGLAPAVADGRVQLHGIDLKGGMEIRMGEPLFTSTAINAAEAVVLLERLVGEMQDRTRAYAGRVRSHIATIEEPLHVVMIDELAALTAYSSERELQRRAEAAINLLCSQGRAPGFMVFACLQDPRKEVIPSRGLFTQMIGLRLKDLSETAMVLGEQALDSGAHCHRILRETPGVGYVLPEEGGHPIRVRAGFASDEAIRAAAERYATPVRLPIVVEPEDEVSRQRRQSRSAVR